VFTSLYSIAAYDRSETALGRRRSSVEQINGRSSPLSKPNFNFQKRQKELAKKRKNEEKRQRKLEKNAIKPAEDQPTEGGEASLENGGDAKISGDFGQGR
jgi:hypothetical protein